MNTIVIDPITRIEGHLRIQAQTDEAGVVTRATSSGTVMRGIETILLGRDPRDAWAITQRICGVCTLTHAVASVRAVENTLKWSIPANAQLIRNLMIGALYVHDHVMHFYHLHALDWVDVVSALSADPAATADLQRAISPWPKNSAAYFAEVRTKLSNFVQGGQLGIFANGYWGHPQYKLPPEANLLAFAHYLEAMAWQREVAKLHAVFGGKNPHPSMVPGGVPVAIATSSKTRFSRGSVAVDPAGLAIVGTAIARMREFVEQVYLPDTLAIAGFYKEWASVGEGLGNFLTFGEFPQSGAWGNLLIPGGAIIGRDLTRIHPVDPNDPTQVQEYVSNSWYDYRGGKHVPLHPYQGETTPAYTGPTPPYTLLDDTVPYSWLKSPRWKNYPMEVGPLARVLMLYASGNTAAVDLVDDALARLQLPLEALYSTLGRTLARTLETRLIAEAMPGWFDQLNANIRARNYDTFNEALWNPATWPAQASGVGMAEAPRGALAHWLILRDRTIGNYQIVVPSTWNAGPRDSRGQEGPYEAALRGQALHDVNQPLEILRTVHSFDPCLACAVHLVDPQGRGLVEVKVC